MTPNAEQYVDLMKSARRHFQARNRREAQIAYNVAQQFYRDLSPAQRTAARAALIRND